jgi:hypothetical protein
VSGGCPKGNPRYRNNIPYTIRISRILRITLYNLSYYSSLYGLIRSIIDRALINQLASFNPSLSSCNIILKASVIVISVFKLKIGFYRYVSKAS